jgi:hypothetical protein
LSCRSAVLQRFNSASESVNVLLRGARVMSEHFTGN